MAHLFRSRLGFIDPATLFTVGVLASTVLVTVITAQLVNRSTENRTPAVDNYSPVRPSATPTKRPTPTVTKIPTLKPLPTNTPSPTPKNCSYASHNATACVSSTQCVRCVNGATVNVDSSYCEGKPCGPQPIKDCTYAKHSEYACKSYSQCVQCWNGSTIGASLSDCAGAGKACGQGQPTPTPRPTI